MEHAGAVSALANQSQDSNSTVSDLPERSSEYSDAEFVLLGAMAILVLAIVFGKLHKM